MTTEQFLTDVAEFLESHGLNEGGYSEEVRAGFASDAARLRALAASYPLQQAEMGRLREDAARLAGERDAWREHAEHQEHCRACAEDSVDSCFDGKSLKDAAFAASVR